MECYSGIAYAADERHHAISSIIAIGALVQIAPPLTAGEARPDDWIRWLAGFRYCIDVGQHVRWFRRYPTHAGDVSQIR